MTLQALLVPCGVDTPGWTEVAREALPDDLTLETSTGCAALRPDPRVNRLRGHRFVAAWVDGTGADAVDREREPTLMALRASALVVASPDGLRITRGPYGGRPLFYKRDGNTVHVSSTLAPLVQGLTPHPPFDVDCLAAAGLATVPPDPRATIYERVRRVLPCETVAFTARGEHSSFTGPRRPDRAKGTVFEHATAMREELSRAIKRVLHRHSAVGVFTGGGLDSSGVLSLVAQLRARGEGPRFTGVTLDFAGGEGDDRPHLEALLELLRASTLRVSPRDVRASDFSFFTQDAAPYTWPSCPAELLAARRAKDWGADVLMTGVGGDDVLDGDERRFAERAAHGDLSAIVDAARMQLAWTRSARIRLSELIIKPLVRRCAPPKLLARRRMRWLRTRDAWCWGGPRVRALVAMGADRQETHEDWFTSFALSHALMDVSDAQGQSESATGLPWVAPYLDHEFVELVASLPPDEMFYDHRQRGLFRLAMRGLLPESLRLRSDKASFDQLSDETFASLGGFDGFRDLLTMEATADLGLVLPRQFRETFGRVARGEPTARAWLEVWPMLAVESFLQSAARATHSRVEA